MATTTDTTGSIPVIKVLFAIHEGADALDVLGPYEVFTQSLHNKNDPTSNAFECTFASAKPQTFASQDNVSFKGEISFDDVHKTLKEYDVLVIPGGNVLEIIKEKAQPLTLIKAFADLQTRYPEKERTLVSISTGSLLLGHAGILSGLSATTHPDYFAKFETINGAASQRDLSERPDVLEERYVVNNLRFDLEDPEQEGFIRRKSEGRRPSNARKGSMSWKQSNTRRESNARRAAMRLGGLRVITTGATSCGFDGSLYLVGAMVSEESALEVARVMQHNWIKGVVVDGIDV